MTPARITCVLGMHRSGTSLLSRVVGALGAELGPERLLTAAAPDNPKGFFESRPLVEVNKEILERMGGRTMAPPALPPGWEGSPQLDDLRGEARGRVAAHFGHAAWWSWKDPRTSLTVAFWQTVLDPMTYLVCVRDPEAVAASLARRHGMPADQAVHLWLTYTLGALRGTAGHPRRLVLYDRLLDHTEAELVELAAFLGVPQRAADAAASVEHELRHHPVGPDPDRSSEVRSLAGRAYALLAGADPDLAGAARELEAGLEAAARARGRNGGRAAPPRVSIVINNYDYGRFLGDAIESALAQSHRPLEVVVVDDGSTDESRAVIESFGDRIVPVLKENGGQASAINAGFRVARGDVVIFLDADDMLLPDAARRASERFDGPGVVKVHWPLHEVDGGLRRTGRILPTEPLPEGDLREGVFRDGPSGTISSPTSGNAWSRGFLERVMPIPEAEHRLSADAFLFGIAPAFGEIRRVAEPLGLYRVHGGNRYTRSCFGDRLQAGLSTVQAQWRAVGTHAHAHGVRVDRAAWERRSYFHQLQIAVSELEAIVPPGGRMLLADEARWALDATLGGRPVVPFTERDGVYWGVPEDDAAAIRELERLRIDQGAGFLAVAWPAFWWLDHFTGFASHLRRSYARVLANARLIVHDLSRPPA